MPLPSYNIPASFQAFGRQRSRLQQDPANAAQFDTPNEDKSDKKGFASPGRAYPAAGPTWGLPAGMVGKDGSSALFETGPMQDEFLNAEKSLKPKRLGSLFLLGLGLSLAGYGPLNRLLGKWKLVPKQGPVRLKTNSFNIKGQEYVDEMNLAQSYEGLSSVYLLGQRAPHLQKALMAYLGTGIVGYVAGSTVQGSQEVWVRREETRIRARLINRMTGAFAQSIRKKAVFDDQLRAEARSRIVELLTRYHIPNAAALISSQPLGEPDNIRQRYFYEPTHRTSANPRFSAVGGTLLADSMTGTAGPSDAPTASQASTINLFEDVSGKKGWRRFVQGAFLGAGLLVGLALQAYFRLFSRDGKGESFPGKVINYETNRLTAMEALIIHASTGRQNLFVAAGYFALAAAAKLGKLFIDGLREIEVTRANARTELSYQTHNWLTQDPAFHEIAETEALSDSLRQLETDLPALQASPQLLQRRIQTILGNVGRNSAPRYFSMTPAVQLSIAKA